MSHCIKAKPNFIKSSFARYVGAASVVTASLFSSMTLASSDILMYDLNADGQLAPESKINITNRSGYDNQPFFSQNGPIVVPFLSKNLRPVFTKFGSFENLGILTLEVEIVLYFKVKTIINF